MLYLKVKSIALHLNKERAKEFVDVCRAHAEASRADEGNISFEMKYVRLPGAVKVTFLELWRDRESLDKHTTAAKNREHIAKINEMRSFKETIERETDISNIEDIDAIVKRKK